MVDCNRSWRWFAAVSFVLIFGALPLRGGSAVVGTVAGGTNAMVGEQALVPNTTLFSGDRLSVKDGSAMVAMPKGGLIVLGRDTAASFERTTDQVNVALSRGSVSLLHPADGTPLCVKLGSVSILPGKGFRTLGDVAVVDDLVVVTAKEGSLVVEGADRPAEVKKGRTITIKNVAASGQVGAAAGAAHVSMNLITPLTTAVAGVTSAAVTGVAISHASSAQTSLTSTATSAQSASQSAGTASTSASGAASASGATCTSVSPTDTSCTSH